MAGLSQSGAKNIKSSRYIRSVCFVCGMAYLKSLLTSEYIFITGSFNAIDLITIDFDWLCSLLLNVMLLLFRGVSLKVPIAINKATIIPISKIIVFLDMVCNSRIKSQSANPVPQYENVNFDQKINFMYLFDPRVFKYEHTNYRSEQF